MLEYLQQLMNKQRLQDVQAQQVMETMLNAADPFQVTAFLAILAYRGETCEELAGMVRALQKQMRTIDFSSPFMDIVGTGGDQAKTVNISTASAILAAACGLPIVKHGNRSVSSRSGSADFLEALGIAIELPEQMLQRCFEYIGIAFLFAPAFSPMLKRFSAVRQGLKLPTVFNLIGPLLNPGKAQYALIGVSKRHSLELISDVIIRMGQLKRAWVFHGSGLDELTTLGIVEAYEIRDGKKTFMEIDPRCLGFSYCRLEDLQGGDAFINAKKLLETFSGKPGAIADALSLNAGIALYVFGTANTMAEGIEKARDVLRTAKALELIEKWKNFT